MARTTKKAAAGPKPATAAAVTVEAVPGIERLSAALTETLARRTRLGDLSHAGGLKHETLKRRILSGYRKALDGASDTDMLAWLLDRLASVEAQVITLQQARADQPAPPPPARATPASEPVREAVAPRNPPPESAPPPPVAAPAPPPKPALPKSLIMPCDAALVNKGFYDAERTPQGRSFRWIGPEPRATLYLPRIEAPLELRLHLHGAFVREALPLVRVSLDKGAWAGVRVTQGSEGTVLVARPAAGDPGQPQVMRLDIDAAMADSPANRGEPDRRVLSIALAAVEAVCVAD